MRLEVYPPRPRIGERWFDALAVTENWRLHSGCELVPYNRQIFEITKIRYKEFYEKCIPLENFTTSEVQLCSLYFELLNGSKYYSFIGENAEEYAKSLVSYQYSINDILFNEISNIDDLKEWIGRASSKKKVRNLIINRNADFVWPPFWRPF